jgi:hypothetical protein
MYMASNRCIAVKMWLKCSCVLWVGVNVTISVALYLVTATYVFSLCLAQTTQLTRTHCPSGTMAGLLCCCNLVLPCAHDHYNFASQWYELHPQIATPEISSPLKYYIISQHPAHLPSLQSLRSVNLAGRRNRKCCYVFLTRGTWTKLPNTFRNTGPKFCTQ